MKKLVFILTLCLVLAAVVPANANSTQTNSGNVLKTNTVDSVVREVTGQGRNRDEAIKNALYQAIAQSRGVKVDSANAEMGYRGTSAGFGTMQPGQRNIEIDSLNFSTQGTVYTTEIKGLIKGFEVVEEKQVNDQTYEVKLKVNVYDYSMRGLTPRVKVALMPVKTMENAYHFLDQSISGETLSNIFTQRLMMGLTQTNKFAVLDRESIRAFVDEKEMLHAFDAPLSQQAKLAETLGADYLLVGNITQAVIERIDTRLETANFTSTQYQARINFNYRLVDSATKQVVLALDEQKYLKNDEVRNLSDEENTSLCNSAQIRDAFLSIAANEVIEKIIDQVYPIKIAAIQDDGSVVLNQGGERMKPGMILDVFTRGKEILDPDTGQSLGTTDNLVAAIEIQRVANNLSYAKLIDGTADKISEGLVCRVRQVAKPGIARPKSGITRTESGGVVLPFDR
jgi:curli biogenesis system outer membrane secretion channel CsgG